MHTYENQAIKHIVAIREKKQTRDFLRMLDQGHTFYRQDATHWECRKADGTTYQIYVHKDKQVCTCPAIAICAHIHAVWTLQRLMPQLED